MLRYVIQRILSIGLVLVAMSMLIFAVMHILPGNVANMIAGEFAPPDVIQAIEQKLGLDDPLWVQYLRWAAGLSSGDPGVSLIMDRPVGPVVFEAFKNSAVLALVAFPLVVIFGIGFGAIAAIRHNRLADRAISHLSYIGISVPDFFWGILLIIIFASFLHWLPSGGIGDWSRDSLLAMKHLVLPVLTLTATLVAHVSRLTRSSMLETLQSHYVNYARAKGLPERVVIIRHALRNALLPTITILAADVGWLLGGIVVVESVFAYPGLGRLLVYAVEHHDVPMIQFSILFIGAIYCLANLVADLLYAFFNPKIRYGAHP
jgi:peptide/nickel transport system permease protein